MSVRTAIEEQFRRRWIAFDDRFREYDLSGLALISPVLLFFAVVSLIPILYGFWLSFHSGTPANLSWTGIDNYVALVQAEGFWLSAYRGTFFAVYTVALQLVIGVGVALALHHVDRFSNLIRAIVFLPYLIPTVAVAVVFEWIFQAELGVLNYILLSFGAVDSNVSFFTEELAMQTVVWSSTWKWTVFVILIVLARLQSVDETLYEAAKTNGAGLLQQFRDVTWPQIRSVVMLIVLLRSIWQFSKFELIYLLTQGGPFDATTTMVIYAYRLAFDNNSFGMASAVTTMIFLLLLIFAVVYFVVFSPEEEIEVKQ